MKPNSSSRWLGCVRVRERGVVTLSAVLSQAVFGPPVRHSLLPYRLVAEAPHPVGSSPWGTISSEIHSMRIVHHCASPSLSWLSDPYPSKSAVRTCAETGPSDGTAYRAGLPSVPVRRLD